jgi:ATP/maltotriose-dependent transcriptional regulator MalT
MPTLVRTKLYVPRARRGLVPRPRLSELLSRASASRLILVSAPAGFGKTTLLSTWLGASPTAERRVAWVSLEESEQAAAAFWVYVVTSLDEAAPGVGAGALPLLQSANPPIRTVLATLLNELEGVDGGLDLVLDDYHLADGPAIATDMTFLVEHLPENVRLVISTRADPTLPLARLRARGELTEVRAADLRFTHDEVTTYLDEVVELELAPADIASLESRTEGWIAALQLAALSLRGRADPAAFIAGFAGDDRYVVDYLVEEVLARQRDDVRRFLLQTSILDRLSGALCDAVTGRSCRSSTAPTCSSSLSTTTASGTATTTCSPMSSERTWRRRGPRSSAGCTAGRGSGTTRQGSRLRRSATRSRRETSRPRRTGSSGRSSACCATGRRPRPGAGSTISPRGWWLPGRCSRWGSSAR